MHTLRVAKTRLKLLLLGGAAAMTAAPSVAAQELDTIVVTAQKREENLQDTPISVSAATAASIERTGATNIAVVAEMAPNVIFDTTAPISGASNAAGVTIRGIGQTDFALTTEAGVGTYVDGVYTSRSLGGVLDVLDIERMEILRGPQGTLFGRNTIGGAINIISTRPSDEFGGKLEISGGNQGRVHLRGSVDIPLADNLRTRLSASSKNRNGFVESGFSGADFTGAVNVPPIPILPAPFFNQPVAGHDDLGDENRQAVRGTIEWEPAERLRLTVFGDYSRVRENDAPNRLVGVTGDEDAIVNGVFVPAPLRGPAVFLYNLFEAPTATPPPGFADAFYNDANYVTGKDVTYGTASPTGTRLDGWGLSGSAELELRDNLRAKSITAYRETWGSFNRDADGSPFPITHTHNFGYEHQQFSQELQLLGELFDNRIKWILGGYYFTEEGSDPIFVDLPTSFGDVFQEVADIDNQSFAGFAQATFDVTSALSVTAGIRYTEDEKNYTADQYLIVGTAGGAPGNPFFPVQPPGLVVPLVDICAIGALVGPPCPPVLRDRQIQNASQTFDDVSPRFSAQYRWNEALMTYASYSQGFKSGGFNLRYVQPSPNITDFSPENVSAYEAGFKFEGFDRRVRINAAGFFTDYKDIQITFFEVLGAPQTINGGSAEIWGSEVEVTALATPDLIFTGAVGFTSASYKSVQPVAPTSVSTPEQVIDLNTELPNTPRWTASAAIDYTFPELPIAGSLEFHADWRYTGDVFNDAQNSPFLFQEAYNVVNLGLTYAEPNERWSVRLWSDNVANERYILSGDSNFGLGFHQANFNRPREYGATVRANF